MQFLSPHMGRIAHRLFESEALEKRAETVDTDTALQLHMQKAANDNAVFELVKEAISLAGVREGASAMMHHPLAQKALGGAAVAAGAAVPATLAVNAMSDHATEQARNRALQTGAGLAAMGAGLYGIHKMTSQAKTAAEETAWLDNAISKLASVGFLDEMLCDALADNTTSADAKKLAAEVRMLNREYGVEILRNLART